ncbi:MAG: hypothetical protein OXS29_00330 [bacterium]|nr:hypothetical protein [bacterium]MDE0287871.1 hypothetical protein [bacterium]MDE0436791.1 hypothetical protein [bacterium]
MSRPSEALGEVGGLASPDLADTDLEEAYMEMASDEARESVALDGPRG